MKPGEETERLPKTSRIGRGPDGLSHTWRIITIHTGGYGSGNKKFMFSTNANLHLISKSRTDVKADAGRLREIWKSIRSVARNKKQEQETNSSISEDNTAEGIG